MKQLLVTQGLVPRFYQHKLGVPWPDGTILLPLPAEARSVLLAELCCGYLKVWAILGVAVRLQKSLSSGVLIGFLKPAGTL